MLEHDIKKTIIYDFPKSDRWEYELVGESEFSFPFDDKVKEDIAKYYAEYAGGNVYDGDTICLAGIEKTSDYTHLIKISMGRFYDFLLANVIGREVQSKNDRLIRSIAASGASNEVIEGIKLLGERYRQAKNQINCFEDLLSQPFLPNAIAISALVKDENNNFLVSQRTRSVVIGKNLGGVTATGTLELGDCIAASRKDRSIDPFCACAQRELSEESEFKNVDDECFRTRGLFVGHAKLQPIGLVDVEVSHDLSGYLSTCPCGSSDADPELKKVVAVPKEKLQSLVFKYDMTEASAYHMLMHNYD